MFWLQSAGCGFREGSKELAEVAVDFAVGANVGADGVANGVLIDGDELIKLGEPFKGCPIDFKDIFIGAGGEIFLDAPF